MPVDLNVPQTNQQAPSQPKSVTVPANPQVQALANTKAVSILKQKNRKAKGFEIRFAGLLLNFESGTVGQMLGFTPDSDTRTFVLRSVEFTIKGGSSGSKTTLEFDVTCPQIKAGS